jgi:hypothetical protein
MEKPGILLRGAGSAITNEQGKQRRAKAKLITQTVMLRLIEIATERGAVDQAKAYRRTYYCQSRLYVVEGRMHAPLCRNRFCNYCCGVRKAELINSYYPEIETWKDAHLLTLTRLAVPAHKLKAAIADTQAKFRQIIARLKKRHLRGTGCRIMGLRALECNFNAQKRTYNPHFHLIVPTKEVADALLTEWLKEWGPRYATREAKNCRKIKNTIEDLIEVIKYETKIITDPEPKRGKKKGRTYKIFPRALDTIYTAMKGERLVERFGFNLPKVKKEKQESRIVTEYEIWDYHLRSADWLHADHESTLTSFEASFELQNILSSHIQDNLR